MDYGQKIDASLTTIDNGITLTANTANQNGSSHDLGANTDPQAVVVRVQFTIENQEGSPTDGYDCDIRVQNSPDNSNWPDAGHGQALGNFTDTTAGADLTRSQFLEFVPKCRYFRFQYDNNNGTDDLVVTSKILEVLMQGKA